MHQTFLKMTISRGLNIFLTIPLKYASKGFEKL